MANKVENQIKRELLGISGMNPFVGHDSSSRGQMYAAHLSQALVVSGSTERFIQTGMEREYGKYTFSVKMPTDAEIIRVVERYPNKIGVNSIASNPQTVVIYEDVNTKEVGIVNITSYCSFHQYFGFEYKPKSALHGIRSGAFIPKDTVLLDSPSITDNGGYKYGVECNMAFMSHPAVSEDGILISSDVLSKFSFKIYEVRVVEFGNKRFPLNLYGDATNYKPFPDIGDKIRSDGLLMCLREYDKDLAVVEQGILDLMDPDFIFDKMTYVGGEGGKIVDIRVQHDPKNTASGTPVGMETQAEKYDRARRQFYQEIVNEYSRLKRDRGDALRVTPEFHRLIVEALSVVDSTPNRIVKLYRQAPLDDWRIEFVVEYEITPTIGFKMTGCHGDKGVICKVVPPDHMPVDEAGNRADIVMDPNSTISRMNLGRLYEQYINAASRDVLKKIRSDLNIPKGTKDVLRLLKNINDSNPDLIDKVWNYLLGYYSIVSPKMYVWFTDGEYKNNKLDHLASIIEDNIYLYMPPDNEPETQNVIKELEKFYRPTYSPVTYINNSGERCVTKNNVRIGSMYMMLLEKTGDDWTAVSSGKLQHFGVLSQVTNSDKYAQPSRQQAIRALGESEVRIYASYAGARITADILDRNNNPDTHKAMLYSLLRADKPTNIDVAVDRSKIPLGGAKPNRLVKHILEVSGIRFKYAKYKPQWHRQE